VFKKFINILVIFTTLFYFSFDLIYAYEFYDRENEDRVNDMIVEIYDAKEQYEDLVGDYMATKVINQVSSNKFWWPIGSQETEEKNGKIYATGTPFIIDITSYFGGDDGFRTSLHGGVDIGNGGNGPGVVNIIAAKSGEVIYPTNDNQISYEDNGYYGNKDGGGFGNYVKIKHSDGTYTIYAHLAKDSITVKSGDVVDQGQVIGKMGNSGSSTGTHLHFEIRLGSDSSSNRVDPLEYIDPNNPRPLSFGSGDSFSLTTTTLSKEEFVARMNDYYNRTKKEGFYKKLYFSQFAGASEENEG
jgi:murein DD-endopeptidase MepM/ murein hydrolase activator NlpD